MSLIPDTTIPPPNARFTKVYPLGVARLRSLLAGRGGAAATKVWAFLIQHCGHDNALVCSADLMAEDLGCSRKTITRATKYLEEAGAIVIAKTGTSNVYILNDAEVWKTYEEHKRFCGFRTRTLVGFKENAGFRKRLTHVLGEPRTGDLFTEAAD